MISPIPTLRGQGRVPYGVYDMARNEAWVSVGWDHDTPAFAVASIRHWWQQMGCGAYPDATRPCSSRPMLGGSNGYRLHAWKHELQQLADDTGLTIEVSHFPPVSRLMNSAFASPAIASGRAYGFSGSGIQAGVQIVPELSNQLRVLRPDNKDERATRRTDAALQNAHDGSVVPCLVRRRCRVDEMQVHEKGANAPEMSVVESRFRIVDYAQTGRAERLKCVQNPGDVFALSSTTTNRGGVNIT